MAAGGRTPKQRRFEMSAGMATLRNVSNTPRRRRGSCKCLFGAPDREETRRLMAEQYARERKRFIRRFNFDVETECAYKAAKLDSPVKFREDDKENSESPIRTAPEALSCVENTDLRMLGSPSRRSTGSNSNSPRTPRTPRTPRAARTPRTPRTPASRRQLQMTERAECVTQCPMESATVAYGKQALPQFHRYCTFTTLILLLCTTVDYWTLRKHAELASSDKEN